VNDRVDDEGYNRTRADRTVERQNDRIDKLRDEFEEQRRILSVHVNDCTAQRRETTFALERLREGQKMQVRVVLACVSFLAALALGLKSSAIDAALKAWGML
jgi:septal ring factor EnvC (AmiA/AmiB activator)